MGPEDLGGAGGGIWAVIGSVATALGVGVYRGLRGVKADARQDTTVADLDARLKAERERADKFAAERMSMASDNAALRATLDGLRVRIDALEVAVKEKDARIDALEREVDSLEAAYDILVEEAATTNVLLQQSGHRDIIERVQEMHHEREKAMRLLQSQKGAHCSPAEPPPAANKRPRLSGNAAPLKEVKA